MPKRVGTHDAKTHLSEYLNQVAYAGERVIIERHDKPVAALVSMADLHRLEALDSPQTDQQEMLRREFVAAGIEVTWPTETRKAARERRTIRLDGQPLSEQIIAERR